jgi:hypothetical protein
MFARSSKLALCISLFASSVALADQDDASRYPEDLPAALEVPAAEKLTFVALGVGVQIYDCHATANGSQWVFRAPEATLYANDDAHGNGVATHYAGPTWQANDGGTVVGAVAARVSSPTPGNIPWLRLNAVAHNGPGLFGDVSTIQRLDTVGGVAPAGPCTVGDAARVPYQAHYYFYKPHDAGN